MIFCQDDEVDIDDGDDGDDGDGDDDADSKNTTTVLASSIFFNC